MSDLLRLRYTASYELLASARSAREDVKNMFVYDEASKTQRDMLLRSTTEQFKEAYQNFIGLEKETEDLGKAKEWEDLEETIERKDIERFLYNAHDMHDDSLFALSFNYVRLVRIRERYDIWRETVQHINASAREEYFLQRVDEAVERIQSYLLVLKKEISSVHKLG
ncbi:hypothetical protein B0O99DRAFT_268989 [Bisporella sp. PMI_857]|nr:hypothetical protein B0O99DRAFT_268989 [Bisporella sp. PMI_857]